MVLQVPDVRSHGVASVRNAEQVLGLQTDELGGAYMVVSAHGVGGEVDAVQLLPERVAAN